MTSKSELNEYTLEYTLYDVKEHIYNFDLSETVYSSNPRSAVESFVSKNKEKDFDGKILVEAYVVADVSNPESSWLMRRKYVEDDDVFGDWENTDDVKAGAEEELEELKRRIDNNRNKR